MRSVIDQLLRISREETSPGYLSGEELVEYVEHPDRHLYVYDDADPEQVREITNPDELAATDARVRGFVLTGIYDREAYADVVSVDVDEILERTPLRRADFPLSQFKVIAVDSDHTGEGIGSALTATGLAPLFENPPVTSMLWERDDSANIKLAERYANNRLTTFEDYFPPDWDCPDCGFENECHCDVTMYGWFADARRGLVADD